MENLKKLWILSLFALLASGCRGPQAVMAQQGTVVSVQTFYDELAPYGQWIADPTYGYVWVPDVEPGFRPYTTRGHWVMTEYGNTWVSDYAWGWAPFHYGRWNYDSFYGWVWVPGQEWGPAWVAWRSGGGYYGWAPLGPGMPVQGYVNLSPSYWCFVPQRYITSPRLYGYYAPAPRVVNIYQNTTIINNYYSNNNRTYVQGPRPEEIRQHTRRDVPVHRVNNQPRPSRTEIRNGSVNLYRPDVAAGRNDSPSRVATRESFTPRTGRPADSRNESGGRAPDLRNNNNNDASGNPQQATRVRPERAATQIETGRPAPARSAERVRGTGREAAPENTPRPGTPARQSRTVEREQREAVYESAPQMSRPERVERTPRQVPDQDLSGRPQTTVRERVQRQEVPAHQPMMRERERPAPQQSQRYEPQATPQQRPQVQERPQMQERPQRYEAPAQQQQVRERPAPQQAQPQTQPEPQQPTTGRPTDVRGRR